MEPQPIASSDDLPAVPVVVAPLVPSMGERVARLLYTNNPFYAISAALVMFGLHRSFEGPTLGTHPWHLLGILGGYLLLLSATAFAVVRFGKVWDDGRMIILLVLVLLLGLSVSFDGILARGPQTGGALLFAGLGLAVTISEGLLWGLRVRLPAGYRIPFYVLLAVFFLYPLAMVEVQRTYGGDAAGWGAFFFPAVMGAAFLLLMPAVRRGPDYLVPSTPWGWPWFPWTLFVPLALGAGARSWYLTISFVPGLGLESTFGLYFLAPLWFAGAVLLLEWGIVARRAIVQQAALASTAAIVWMSLDSGAGGDYQAFLERLVEVAGSPLYLAVVASIVFHGYALVRGVYAQPWLIGALLLTQIAGPRSVVFEVPSEPVVWPLFVLAAMAVRAAWLRPSAARELWAAAACLGALSAALWQTPWMDFHGLVFWNALLAASVWISLRYDDHVARRIRGLAGWGIVLASLAVVLEQSPASARSNVNGPFLDRPWASTSYLLCWSAAAGLMAWRSASLVHLVAATVALGCAASLPMQFGRELLAGSVVERGLDLIFGGLAFFLLAALVSLEKAGVVRRAWEWCLRHRASVERARQT